MNINSTISSPVTENSSVSLRPYNLKELAALYAVSYRTIVKWLKPFDKYIGKRNGYYYSIPQVREIFRLLHFPSVVHEEEGRTNK